MTEADRPAGPYWRTLVEGRRVPKIDLGALIRRQFQTTAARILCEDFELTPGVDGLPDLTSLDPEHFESELGALVGRFTLAYIDTIRDVFVEHLRAALGGESAEPDGADEWQVGSLNVYPDEGWELEMIAEELHDALLIFGPAEGAFRLEVGTIAGRVWSSLTDDLGITMTHPAYRDGVFDPDLFARNMELQFIDTDTFGMLTTLMASMQKIVEVTEGKAALADLKWPKPRYKRRRPFAAPPWVNEARNASPGGTPVAPAGEGAEPSAPPTASPVATAPPKGEREPAADPSPPTGDLQQFFGRLFGGAPPSGGDNDPE